MLTVLRRVRKWRITGLVAIFECPEFDFHTNKTGGDVSTQVLKKTALPLTYNRGYYRT